PGGASVWFGKSPGGSVSLSPEAGETGQRPLRLGGQHEPEFISPSSPLLVRRVAWLRWPKSPSAEVPMIARLTCCLAAAVLLAPVARGDDKAKDVDKIPKAVMDALKAKFP